MYFLKCASNRVLSLLVNHCSFWDSPPSLHNILGLCCIQEAFLISKEFCACSLYCFTPHLPFLKIWLRKQPHHHKSGYLGKKQMIQASLTPPTWMRISAAEVWICTWANVMGRSHAQGHVRTLDLALCTIVSRLLFHQIGQEIPRASSCQIPWYLPSPPSYPWSTLFRLPWREWLCFSNLCINIIKLKWEGALRK